ncbi:uncharacterized protein TNCT_446881 [Trichonephila clavata]|uniref:Outer membrane protein beta-barrel domain-containing protein n=1 Tax=Trichonephila clavata TaxID=2740835 RepID=A0A8X6L9W3_TRICU|nr:uncharacterized protein TNCT_632601 [Trichonephila clavata]GFQ99183.1 uncharacterized protein TNCT_313131 [Trichonephila clavata]GFR17616.1 uncharacterized protein TNCT_446881 [Trichonephila clavata]
MKRLCVLTVLLTSSLAGAATNSASKSEDQYYAGLNFGAGWGSGLKIKPSVVFGYNYDKNSKFELEVLTDISDMFGKQEKKMGASLLANYRYYPDLDIDPVKLYVSGGLGGYLQVMPFSLGEGEVVDKILGSISYKLKVGVDYEIAPQIVGTAGVTAGGQLSGIKAKQIPDAILEVGIRYNF